MSDQIHPRPFARLRPSRRSELHTPEEVEEMLSLHEQGHSIRSLAKRPGWCRNTVRKYIRDGYQPFKTQNRKRALDGLEEWLKERLVLHEGNADVVRQDLAAEKEIVVSLRTVERAVAPFRRELAAKKKATVRFETKPGQQLQIDFGSKTTVVGGKRILVHLFVATLGFCRRHFVMAFTSQRQSSWMKGLEAAFAHFGGVPREVLVDNAKALVTHHNRETREVIFNEKFHAFAKHWGFRPIACAPYRARTKGKDERMVGYVKRNAIAGHSFESFAALEAHLAKWTREIADVRVHGTTKKRPIDLFAREADALAPLRGKPSFVAMREHFRKVHGDLFVHVDANYYTAPWRLIGSEVVRIFDKHVHIFHRGVCVATHREAKGSHQRVVDRSHFDGLSPRSEVVLDQDQAPDLARPLDVYQRIVDEAS